MEFVLIILLSGPKSYRCLVKERDMMKRREFLWSLTAGMVGLVGSPNRLFAQELMRAATDGGSSTAGRLPNIILIMADDLGWGDLSCYPQQREREGVALDTPNLDRFAAEGVRCTQAYATSPICAPSRAGLLSGRYQQLFGFYEFYETLAGIPREEITIGEIMKKQGYATAFFGKWHSSDNFEVDGPLKRGFDRFYGFIGQHDYFDPRNGMPLLGVSHSMDAYMVDQDKPVKDDSMEYLTDGITRRALEYMETQARKNQPFFLYLPYNAPHPPMQATWEKLRKYYPYEGKKGFTARDLARAMIDSLDEGVGKIMEKLKELGIDENTLVIFTSDNGGADDGPSGPPQSLVQHNGGLRCRKGYYFEGGIRVPFLMRWPGRIPAQTVYEAPVSHLDVFTTIAAAATVANIPENKDGVDLIPYFQGKRTCFPHEVLYWGLSEKHDRWAIRKGPWKLIHEMPSPVATRIDPSIRETALYNLEEDPHETRNRMDDYPEVAIELLNLKKEFYKKAKPSIVTEEQDREWRKKREAYYKANPDLDRLRRDGYPECWR